MYCIIYGRHRRLYMCILCLCNNCAYRLAPQCWLYDAPFWMLLCEMFQIKCFFLMYFFTVVIVVVVVCLSFGFASYKRFVGTWQICHVASRTNSLSLSHTFFLSLTNRVDAANWQKWLEPVLSSITYNIYLLFFTSIISLLIIFQKPRVSLSSTYKLHTPPLAATWHSLVIVCICSFCWLFLVRRHSNL